MDEAHVEMSIEQQVRKIVLGIIEMVAPDADLSDVKGDVRLRDQLDMDSMDFLDIVMELRKRYKVEVPKEDYPLLATLDSCVSYLAPKLKSTVAVA
jgi:acyl carrier protein